MTNQRTEQTRDSAKRAATYLWWQRGIIYEVYLRSFVDSNGDGVGDLTGLISRLDYLRWLGVDAVWISPLYPSPMKDFGYDVADYTAIHPLFGTLADFDRLIGEAHARDLKVILDLSPITVPTSIRGLLNRGRRATTLNGAGTSGAIRAPVASRQTTGYRPLGEALGNTIRTRSNTITTLSCANSPTSTGAIRKPQVVNFSNKGRIALSTHRIARGRVCEAIFTSARKRGCWFV